MKSCQLLKYACVGGLAFIFDWIVLFSVTDIMKMHYLWGATAGFICGTVINYFLSVSWVFRNRSITSRYVEFVIFTIIGVIGLGLNDLIMYLLTGVGGLLYLQSKLIAVGVVFFWNYYARKFGLFSPAIAKSEGSLQVAKTGM